MRLVDYYDEWETFQIKDLFEIKNGLNKEKEFFGHGIPILNYMDVNQNISNDESSIEGLVDVDESEIKRYNVKPNDLFFTRTSETSNEIGLTSAYIGKEMDCVFSGFILRARPIKNNINSLFLAYHLRTKQNRNNIIKYSSITTRALISGSNLYQMKINIPTLKEQNKIADFLSNIDKKLNSLNQKITQIQEFKKYLLQNIFSQKLRFKGFEEEWEKTYLKDIGTFYRGHSYNSSNVVEDGLLVLRSNNIQNNSLDFDESGLQFVDKDCKPELNLLKGDIVICMSNGTKSLVGKSAQYEGNYNSNLTVGAFCSIFRSNSPLSKYIFQSDLFKRYLYILLAGTNINNLKNSDLEKLSVNIPSLEEQEKIAKFLSSVDQKIELIQDQLSKTENFKKGLLQQMFEYLTSKNNFPINQILHQQNQ